jgi:hypothetical protein
MENVLTMGPDPGVLDVVMVASAILVETPNTLEFSFPYVINDNLSISRMRARRLSFEANAPLDRMI